MKFNTFFFILLLVAAGSIATAQVKTVVTGKAFATDTQNRLYKDLGTKLPQLISDGILYNSSLAFDPVGLMSPVFKDISSRTVETDSIFSRISPELQAKNIRFFIEGDVHVMNDNFNLNIYATDFKTPLAPYHSEIRPLSQLQQEVDKASENLNYQIKARLLGRPTVNVKIQSFKFNIAKNAPGVSKELYASDFPAQYLSYNLHNSRNFAMLPYERVAQRGKSVPLTPDAIISGIVTIENRGSCVVHPVLRWNMNKDSLDFIQIKGSLGARDKLLTDVVTNVQGVFDAIAERGGLKEFLNTLEGYSELDYKDAFATAMNENKPSLANFYADRYAAKSPRNKKNVYLLKAKIYYKAGEFATALNYANQYLKGDSLNEEGNYNAGLCNIKLSNYDAGLMNFQRVKSEAKFPDIHFQRGLCLYGQNLTKDALKEFETQKTKDEKANSELYPFMGLCYRSLGDWAAAEQSFLEFFKSDSLNPAARSYLVTFYQTYGDARSNADDFVNASNYYLKSYAVSRKYGSLYKAIVGFIEQEKPFSFVKPYIDRGIKDSVLTRESIYLDLADVCRYKVDAANNFIPYHLRQALIYLNTHLQNLSRDKRASRMSKASAYSTMGSTYFRLNNLDSAEICYRATLKWYSDDPIDFYNLAEVQIMQVRTDEALQTLEETYRKFISISKESSAYYRGLYYFYVIECKSIKNIDYEAEQQALEQITKLYTYEGSLFEGWSFRTFYNWAKKGELVNPEVRNKLLKNLCLVTKYSKDSSIACAN